MPGTKNRLKCEACGASWVMAVPSFKTDAGWNSSSGARLADLACRMRVDEHRSSCPWRSRRCSPTLYIGARRWSGSIEAITELVENASSVHSIILDHSTTSVLLNIVHPITQTSITDLTSAADVLRSKSTALDHLRASPDTLLLALFGWFSDRTPPPASTSPRSSTSSIPTRTVSCALCHRQIGLWSLLAGHSLATQSSIDLVNSHRDYCPYRDESGGFDLADYEGIECVPVLRWQAHLTLIQRFLDRQIPLTQATTRPHRLETLMQGFMVQETTSVSDPQIWALDFVKGTLSSTAKPT